MSCLLAVGLGETIIGIDLGTTYSAVGIYENGKVEIIPNEQGNRITPSYVAFDEQGDRLIGDAAKNQFSQNPKNTIFEVKRILGRSSSDPTVREDAKNVPFNIDLTGEKPVIEVEAGVGNQKRLRPEAVSGWILGKMKQIAENYLGEEVRKAVVTVPAYFNDEQRQATKDAGKIAGLEIVRILNEPTAAALAFGLDRQGAPDVEKNVLVFDLGGGTFDVSLLTIDGGVFDVLATAGDTHLGGEDFDQRIVDYFVKFYKKKTGHDVRGSPRAMAKLRKEAEKAKRTLSSHHVAKLEIEAFFEGADLSEELTRAKFEELNGDLFRKTMVPVQNVLDAAQLTAADIDEIVLVGGSTRIPKVRQLVENFFKKESAKGINPDESVAYGAAIQAAVIGGVAMDESVVVIDTQPLTLAIETVGGIMAPVVERNSAIPARRTKIFSTAADNQSQVSIRIFEGERPLTKDNNLLGKFELTGIPAAPRGVPQIEVTFEINADGILKVTAEDKGTGSKNEIKIENGSSRLSAAEIEKMIQEANAEAEKDKTERERIESRNELDHFVYQKKYELENAEMPAEQAEAANLAIEETMSWLDGNPEASKEQFQEQRQILADRLGQPSERDEL